ncbi:aminotransferase class V-fold PLP-dependent enzyme [Salinarimonas sp.]|uniref:aminotransferase class V-fold PLP-dependent enzyme n=1 Tax=Salinarimonas sp. TaxID=2766526 RepID=UPI0032D9A19B
MSVDAQALARHRRAFPALAQEGVYADFGARGPMAREAIAAVGDVLESLQAVGPASRLGAALVAREIAALRGALAGLAGVAPERVALVENVSHAIAAAVWGVAWRPGERLVIGAHEPPGTRLVARQAAARFGIACDEVDPNAEGWPAGLADALRPQTRLVVLSHVDWATGRVLDLPEIARVVRDGPAPEAALAIDGAQALGAIPVALGDADVDLYAGTGQKWLGGPDGVGCLILGPGPARLAPSLVGWRAAAYSEAQEDVVLAADARRFESGTGAVASMAGLRVALRVADGFAPLPARAGRIARLGARLRAGLAGLGPRIAVLAGGPGGIVSLRAAERAPADLARALERRGIVAKAHVHPACLRLCVHYLTTESEVDALVEGVAASA